MVSERTSPLDPDSRIRKKKKGNLPKPDGFDLRSDPSEIFAANENWSAVSQVDDFRVLHWTHAKPRRREAIVRSLSFLAALRLRVSRDFVEACRNFTETRAFIFCDLWPKAADLLRSATAGTAPSVTFRYEAGPAGCAGGRTLLSIVKEPVEGQEQL